jgi:F-type H+-transporting ATPase subunit gamma
MSSTREMRMRIRSVKNISQVTRALETVSASYVRKSIRAVQATQPYAEKAWKLLLHLARQPGANSLHPLLKERSRLDNAVVLMISSDRGLAGAYNVNIVRQTLLHFRLFEIPVSYVVVGNKGREMMQRRGQDIMAVFSHLPSPASFMDVSAIGRLLVDEYLADQVDQVFVAYTQFESMARQEIVIRKLLPLEIEIADHGEHDIHKTHPSNSVFTYEPEQTEILEEIVPRFTALQIYQAILSSQASEHAARMIAMRNASDNAEELIGALQLEYNKIRQQGITNDILDIVGGVEALAATR